MLAHQGDALVGLMTLIHRGPGNRPVKVVAKKKARIEHTDRKVLFVEIRPSYGTEGASSTVQPGELYDPDIQVHAGFLLSLPNIGLDERVKNDICRRYKKIDASYDLQAHLPL